MWNKNKNASKKRKHGVGDIGGDTENMNVEYEMELCCGFDDTIAPMLFGFRGFTLR